MTTDRSMPPPDLLARVAADTAPVRPIGSPMRRVLWWLPLGLTLFAFVPLYVGLRADALRLGPIVAWGASLAQVALGVWLLWAGGRESTPGRRLPSRTSTGVLLLAGGAIVLHTALTFARSPTSLAAALWLRAGAFCFSGSLALGAPLLFAAAWLLHRALPGQPWLAGALFGAGAGLTADASWRLVCPISDPWHVLSAHGGAVIALTAIGSLAAHLTARRRLARTSR